MHDKLTKMKLIDAAGLENIGKSPKLPWKMAPVASLSGDGAECLSRAVVKFERRLLGSKAERRLSGKGSGRELIVSCLPLG